MVIFLSISIVVATLLASSTALSAATLDPNGFRWGWNHKEATRKEEAAPPWERPQPDEPLATPGPIFEVTSANIMVRPGADVMLPCRVRNLGDKVVSWIRTKDLHILSSHVYIFTTDMRFSVSHPDGDSASWDLRLKGARPVDQGLYECQVNTEPKMKQAVMLTVNEMELSDSPYHPYADDIMNKTGNMARILGPREQIVREGSTVTLTCEVRTTKASLNNPPPPPVHHHAKPTRLVDWLYEGQLLTFQATRGGISVDTERNGLQVWSRLTLADVSINDMGRYTCKPLQAPSAVVTLIVVEGETMGAMQGHGDDHSPTTSSALHLKSVMSIIPLMVLLIF